MSKRNRLGNTILSHAVITRLLDLVENAVEALRRDPSSFGLDRQIIFYRRLERSKYQPADFSVTFAGRRKVQVLRFHVKFGPSRPLTRYFKKLLEEYGITTIYLNMYAKFRSIMREVARMFKCNLYGPARHASNSLYPRGFHHDSHGPMVSAA